MKINRQILISLLSLAAVAQLTTACLPTLDERALIQKSGQFADVTILSEGIRALPPGEEYTASYELAGEAGVMGTPETIRIIFRDLDGEPRRSLIFDIRSKYHFTDITRTGEVMTLDRSPEFGKPFGHPPEWSLEGELESVESGLNGAALVGTLYLHRVGKAAIALHVNQGLKTPDRAN